MSSNQDTNDKMKTRHLDVPLAEEPLPLRATGPLDDELPWVIEFRVVGTANTIQVQVHETMLIGRQDAKQGIYPDVDLLPFGGQIKGVSREHALVTAKDNRISVQDLSSVNGSRLNAHVLTPGQEYRLRDGDRLTIGQIQLQVRFAVVPMFEQLVKDANLSHAAIPVTGRGEYILVIEDDEDVATVYRLALEHAGYKVKTVNTAVAALGLVSQGMPDAIVVDIMLPDTNLTGIDLVRYFRKQAQERRLPLIVVSGATGGYQMKQAREHGADICLGKPVSVDELVRSVSSLLGSEETKPTKPPEPASGSPS
ncbi:MAG: response regulator [Anaerolineaceae bacterium]|nr:response regulator [Anaerolineaceae bacterium]